MTARIARSVCPESTHSCSTSKSNSTSSVMYAEPPNFHSSLVEKTKRIYMLNECNERTHLQTRMPDNDTLCSNPISKPDVDGLKQDADLILYFLCMPACDPPPSHRFTQLHRCDLPRLQARSLLRQSLLARDQTHRHQSALPCLKQIELRFQIRTLLGGSEDGCL